MDGLVNIVEKGGNAGYQHFLLFLKCFQKASFLGVCIKTGDCIVQCSYLTEQSRLYQP